MQEQFTSLRGSTASITNVMRYITRIQRKQQLASLFATRYTEERQPRTPRTQCYRCSRRWISNVGPTKSSCKSKGRPPKNDIEQISRDRRIGCKGCFKSSVWGGLRWRTTHPWTVFLPQRSSSRISPVNPGTGTPGQECTMRNLAHLCASTR